MIVTSSFFDITPNEPHVLDLVLPFRWLDNDHLDG
jgi:hypothetical protein